MPRVKEATNVKAWRMEELIRDLAVGEKSYAELAEEHGVEEQTIRVFRMRHKADIQVVLAGWANTYDHIWSTKLENHVRVLTERWQKIMGQMELLEEHAQRETETIRSVDPEASEVPYNSREYLAACMPLDLSA
jgi:cell division septum initiation protein DivIVA